MTHLKIVNCHSSSYTQLLTSLGVTSINELTLRLKWTKTSLKQSSFEKINEVYPMLTTLEMRSRGIKELFPHSLDQFPKLKYLNIYQTSIEALPENIFKKLPDLETVSIFWNERLAAIPPTLFDKNWKLSPGLAIF